MDGCICAWTVGCRRISRHHAVLELHRPFCPALVETTPCHAADCPCPPKRKRRRENDDDDGDSGEKDEKGCVATITDLGSRSGVFLDHSRIEPFVRHRLQDSDRFHFGQPNRFTFVFRKSPQFPVVLDSLTDENDPFLPPERKKKRKRRREEWERRKISFRHDEEICETQLYLSDLISSQLQARWIESQDRRSELQRRVDELRRQVQLAVTAFREMGIKRFSHHSQVGRGILWSSSPPLRSVLISSLSFSLLDFPLDTGSTESRERRRGSHLPAFPWSGSNPRQSRIRHGY